MIPPITPGNNVYTGSGDDNVHISKAPGLLGALGLYEVNINGNVQFMTKQQLENTNFHLGAGNDTLVVDSNVTADIHADGGKGNDVMIGGSGDDRFDGGSGNDRLIGRDGNDTLKGGGGDDYLRGDRGRDNLDGGGGTNTVLGDIADFTAEFVLRNPQMLGHLGTVSTVTNAEPRRYGG